jgi:hypothetical protein
MTDDPLTLFAKLTPQAKERIMVFGAIGIVIVASLAWAFLSRRARRRSSRHHRRAAVGQTVKDLSDIKQTVPERRRRRRRNHRPRNPTLAETGGLPPVRSENSSSAGNSISS